MMCLPNTVLLCDRAEKPGTLGGNPTLAKVSF